MPPLKKSASQRPPFQRKTAFGTAFPIYQKSINSSFASLQGAAVPKTNRSLFEKRKGADLARYSHWHISMEKAKMRGS